MLDPCTSPPFEDDCNNPEKEQRELRESFRAAVLDYFYAPEIPEGRAVDYLYGEMMQNLKGQANPSVVKKYIAAQMPLEETLG